jgi:hypothetical protein
VAHWAWADVLAADLMVDEVERVDALQARADRLHGAQLLAMAFHEPKRLADEAKELERETRGAMAVPDPERVVEQVTDLVAYTERIARRQRRRGR